METDKNTLKATCNIVIKQWLNVKCHINHIYPKINIHVFDPFYIRFEQAQEGRCLKIHSIYYTNV